MRRRIRSAAFPVHRHSVPQLLVDGLLVALAYYLAFQLRFDGHVLARYDQLFDSTVLWVVPVSLVIFAAFGLYQRLWTFVGQRDYEAVVKGVVVATLVSVGAITLLHPVQTPPQIVFRHNTFRIVSTAVTLPASVIALFFLLMLTLLLAARFLVHLIVEGRVRSFRVSKGARDVLIVGGGDGGRLVARELARNPQLRLRPVGFIDDDPRKQGMKDEYGLKVLGSTSGEDLERILDEVEPDEVIIAIPSAPGTVRARVVTACRDRGIPVRTTPTVFELLKDGSGQLRVTRQLREVRVEDILGREPVRMELERVGAYLSGQVVLVTGAGGSIGGELCRQIARVGPRRLVLVDHAEDNLFEIMRELEEERHVRTAVPVLADCKEEERMREVLTEHRPAAVFHAAAYKHVTMMELNPVEAVRNNALATRLVAKIAGELGVGTFVLVSTDKAVAPATVMGASKALAEWAVEAAAARHRATTYATVRFGNVLASSGSVVPIFRRQIAAGGPVTVTDPRMRRYFMTIPEAVQLIIRAGSLSEGSGQVFVLEMGEPVRIVDLAETMIKLSGLEPERDIAIEIVGARPGEKFHEDLFNPYERMQPTPAQKILRAEREPLDPDWVEDAFAKINLLVLEADTAGLAEHVAQLARGRASTAGGPAARGRNVDSERSMGSTPLAFSVHHFINSVGADAGFASIIGLAILILLYFAQARETASLRNHAYEAAQRIQELEARVAQLGRASPPPLAAQPISATRSTGAAAPAGAAPVAAAADPGRVAAVGAPVAPAGVAAPALTAATKLIPTPAPVALAPDQPPDATAIATPGTANPPATVAGGANGATQAPPPAVPPRPAAAPVAAQAPPPRMQIRPGATAAPGRRPTQAPRTHAPRSRGALTGTRIAMGLLGVLLVGGVVALLLTLTGNNSTSAESAAKTTNAPGRKHAAHRPAVNPANVNVAVLNGTATAGLANRVALNLSGAGYKRGTVTNATDQTRTTTTVAYLPGFRHDAVAVANSLKLPSSAVAGIDQPTESVACPPPAACAANVVVTVGSNLANIP